MRETSFSAFKFKRQVCTAYEVLLAEVVDPSKNPMESYILKWEHSRRLVHCSQRVLWCQASPAAVPRLTDDLSDLAAYISCRSINLSSQPCHQWHDVLHPRAGWPQLQIPKSISRLPGLASFSVGSISYLDLA